MKTEQEIKAAGIECAKMALKEGLSEVINPQKGDYEYLDEILGHKATKDEYTIFESAYEKELSEKL